MRATLLLSNSCVYVCQDLAGKYVENTRCVAEGFREEEEAVPSSQAASTLLLQEPPEVVYCVCRKGDDGALMLQCEDCQEWFHKDCLFYGSSSSSSSSFRHAVAIPCICYCTTCHVYVCVWAETCRGEGDDTACFLSSSRLSMVFSAEIVLDT
jgi:hypothetical protein